MYVHVYVWCTCACQRSELLGAHRQMCEQPVTFHSISLTAGGRQKRNNTQGESRVSIASIHPFPSAQLKKAFLPSGRCCLWPAPLGWF